MVASDLRSAQREKEREKRRMRDRQRRQNMSLEQRERHLARRRRNYQLRRIRAENAKLNRNPTPTESQQSVVEIQTVNLCSEITDVAGGESGVQTRPRRLRMHQIRQLARLLNIHRVSVGDRSKENGSRSTKTLRLAHIKRLARALKSGNKSSVI